MIPVFDYETMQAVDCYATEKMGIEPLKLMEKAALSMWEMFLKNCKPASSDSFLFLAGSGNNGADTLVIARRAYEAGYQNIEVIIKSEKGSELFELQLARLRSLSVKVTLLAEVLTACLTLSQTMVNHKVLGLESKEPLLSFLKANYLFDGIAGIGTKGAFPIKQSDWAVIFETLLASPLKPLFLAVDLPSGLSETHFDCYPMNYTLTVESPKRAFYHPQARSKCGTILLCHAGFPQEALAFGIGKKMPPIFIDDNASFFLLPFDSASVNKQSRGKVTVFAGSKRYRGAATLASLAASASGAGFVTLVSEEEACKLALTANAGLVVKPHPHRRIVPSQFQADCYLVGSGWDKSNEKKKLLHKILSKISTPLVLDATALRLIAENQALLKALFFSQSASIVLTPHQGEFEALYEAVVKHFAAIEKWLLCEKTADTEKGKAALAFFKKSSPSQQAPLTDRIFYLSCLLQCNILYKGAVSFFSDTDSVYLFDSCRSYLAIAGCGDLLAGIIASLLSTQIHSTQKELPQADSSVVKNCLMTALQIHALAGDLCFQKEGWFNASQMANYIGEATASLFPAVTVNGTVLPIKRENDE